MSPTRSRKVPIGFTLVLCTAFLSLMASSAFAIPTDTITMSKTNDTGGTAAAGQTVVYTIDVNSTANGPQTVITDGPLDANLVFDTTSATTPDNCSYDSGTRIVTCNLQGIGNGDNFVTITTHVNPAAPKDAVITNCADWQSGNYTTTSNSVLHACDGDGFTVVVNADMQVVKTQTSPDPLLVPTVPGATDVTYHIEATNNGPSAAAGVTVKDELSSGAALYEGIANVSTGLDCSSNTNTPDTAFVTFTCTATGTGDPLASGLSLSFDLTLRMPNDGTTSITNKATTTTTTNDPDGTNDTSSISTLICQSVDLAITKACSAVCAPPASDIRTSSFHKNTALPFCPSPITEIQGGANFEYLITVTNNDSSVNATNVTLNDPLPAGVSFVSVSPDPCVSGTIPTNDCNLGTINAGASVSFAITVTAVQSGPVDNSASVSTPDFCERNTNDNTADCQVTINTNNMPTALSADREGCTNVSSPFCTGDPDSTATDSDVNRVFEPGETVRIDPAWTNTLDNADSDVTGTIDALSFTGPAGATYTIIDGTADYGAIPAHTQADCNSATGDCYELQVIQTSLTRPHNGNTQPVHWDAQFNETLSSGETKQWQVHIGDSFTDVPRSDIFYRAVETIYHNHITAGCGDATIFCPFNFTRRDEMAAFITRSVLGLDSLVPFEEPPSDGSIYNCTDIGGLSQFVDVPPASGGFCRHINYLKFIKLTGGCSDASHFCPDDLVTRGQMAVFVAGGMEIILGNSSNPLGSVPLWQQSTDLNREYNCTSSAQIDPDTGNSIPANTPPTSVSPAFSFGDVAATDVPGSQCPFIGFLFTQHVVSGDGAGHYFPDSDIKRDETAAILSNAFVTIPLYGPTFFTPLP